MFDIGFSEIAVIGVVALVVFGPEELPRVARTAGRILGKVRRYVDDVKSEISQEMELEELKRLHEDVKESARDLQSTVSEHVHAVAADLRAPADEVQQELQQAAAAVTHPEPVPDPVPVAEPVPEPASVAEPAAFALTPDPEPEVPAAEAAQPNHDESQLDLFGNPVLSGPKHKG